MSKPLDAYEVYVTNSCEALNEENSTFEKMKNATGLNVLMDGFGDIVKNGPQSAISALFGPDSALMMMGEDVLSSMINENARRLSQSIMGQLDKVTINGVPLKESLASMRDQAFNAMVTVLTFQNDMILHFAAETAKTCITAIHEKDKELQELLIQVRRLHNALLVLAGGGPFFNKYLDQLRQALILLHKAEDEIHLTSSAFYNTNTFPKNHYDNAVQLLAESYEYIMPPVTGSEAEGLDGNVSKELLKNIASGPDYTTQLSMLTMIPALTIEMLKAYDMYVLKMLKVNAYLLGFQSIVQNLKEVKNDSFRDMILKSLQTTKTLVHDTVTDMAEQLNGDETIINANLAIQKIDDEGNATLYTPAKSYKPNVTKTSAMSLKWAMRIKAAQATIELVSGEGIEEMDDSNAALRAYNDALAEFSRLGDMISPLAIVKAENGIEQPGAFEADLIKFSIEANHALIDTTLLESQASSMDSKSVLSIGAKLTAEIELILERDEKIEDILVTFISATKGSLDKVRKLGNSMSGMLDSLGMDRASASLKEGAIGDFFAMSGKTSSYVGAAVAGLTIAKGMIANTAQKECVNNTINTLVVAETSKQLVASRSSKENFAKQQTKNTKRCAALKKQKEKVKGCTVGIDANDLISNPGKQLSKVMGGLFGDSMFDSMEGSPNPISKISSAAANNNALTSIKSAAKKVSSAKDDMVSAVNEVKGHVASAQDDLKTLQKKVDSAKKSVAKVQSLATAVASGDIKAVADQTGVTDAAMVYADEAKETATEYASNVKNDTMEKLNASEIKGEVATYAKNKASAATKYAKSATNNFTEKDVAEDLKENAGELPDEVKKIVT